MRFAPFNEPLILRSLQELFNIFAAGDIEKGKVSNIKTDIFCYPIIGNALTNGGLYGYTDSWKQNNSITVTGRGEIGIAVERPYKYYPIVRLLTLKPKGKSDLKYFECLINSRRILNESTGVPQLTTPQIGKQKYYIVAYEEQRVIGYLFRKIDERIETQNKIIEKYKSLIKCICDSAEMSADRQLKDIANYNSSIIKESIVHNEGKYPVFGAAGICGYLDDYVFSKAGIAIVKDGASVGRLLKIKNDKYSILGTMGLIETKSGVSHDYLWLALKRIKFDKYIVGSGIPHIYFNDYSSAQIPSLTDENFIRAKLCDLLLEKIKIDEDILTNYLKQKTFLLNNLFI